MGDEEADIARENGQRGGKPGVPGSVKVEGMLQSFLSADMSRPPQPWQRVLVARTIPDQGFARKSSIILARPAGFRIGPS
jgi:hypothetical protein